MGNETCCPFFRVPDSINIGTGVGYCDLEGGWAVCEGDFLYCERPGTLALCVEKRLDAYQKTTPPVAAPRLSVEKATIIRKEV